MKKYSIILLSLILVTLTACNFTSIPSINTPIDTKQTEKRNTFSAVMVSGLNCKDITAFSDAMAANGWEPVVTCMGNYCDIGTKCHFEMGATIVFFSGHGYVFNSKGYFNYSVLEENLHTRVDRSFSRTEYYEYDRENIWTSTESYYDMVLHQQSQGAADWIVLAACNQLNLDTRESIINAMKTPSNRPLKGVFSYNNLSGGNMDDYVMSKFVQLCMNNGGQGKVAYAWFAAHYLYAPFLAFRARAALRQGFQNGTLISESATEEHADDEIKFWKFTESIGPLKYSEHSKLTIASEITLDTTESTTTISKMNTEISDPGDLEQSQKEAIDAVLRDSRIPNDFKLYKTGSFIEMDFDGANEQVVAELHTFARYIDNIRVSIDPTHGEYLNVIIDGTQEAEIDLVTYFPANINLDDNNRVKIIPKNELLSKDEIINIGLKTIKSVQTDKSGHYDDPKLKSAELVYVISPSAPDKLVLAWEVMDINFAHATVDALNGSVLYWST